MGSSQSPKLPVHYFVKTKFQRHTQYSLVDVFPTSRWHTSVNISTELGTIMKRTHAVMQNYGARTDVNQDRWRALLERRLHCCSQSTLLCPSQAPPHLCQSQSASLLRAPHLKMTLRVGGPSISNPLHCPAISAHVRTSLTRLAYPF